MKIIEAINTISAGERESLIKYLKSPYFNISNIYENLFIELERSITSPVTNKEIFQKITNQKEYDSNKFRKLCHELIEIILKFKRIEKFSKEVEDDPNIDLKIVKENNFKSHYNVKLKQGNAYFNASRIKNSDFYLKKYNFDKERFDLNTEYDKQVLLEKSPEEFFGLMEKALTNIDTFYLIERLRITNTYFQFYKLLKKENFPDYHKKIADYIISNLIHPPQPLIELYKNTYSLLTNETYHLDIVKINGLLSRSMEQSDKKELSDLFVHYTNYSIRQVLKGNTDYFPILFELYKTGMKMGILPINNPTEYRNIAAAACQIKEFDWALEFVEKYKIELPIDQQESAYSFTKARIFGNMKNWDAVLSTLRNVEYEDMGYILNSKLFMIMAYYELDEYEALDSFIKSFKVFLRRRRNIPVARKNAFYGFTTVVDHIMKAAERRDKKRIAKAYEEIENNKAIPNQDWLKEKISEIEQVL